ncbi:MAG: AraC family transcriptional regulator [Planctomycetota bacterium]
MCSQHASTRFGTGVIAIEAIPGVTRPLLSVPIRAVRAGGWLVVLSRYPSGRGLGWHSHAEASFHLTVAGTSEERYWRFDRSKSPGTAQYYGAGVGHETVFGPGGAVVLHAVCDGTREGGTSRTPPVMSEPSPRYLLPVLRELGLGDDASSVAIEGWCAELEASLAGEASAEHAWPAWLDRVRQRLHDDPAPGLTVAQIADDEGLSVSHLVRAFRQRIGITVGAYLRRRRLQLAAGRLSSRSASLARVALDAGFYDQSHFGRAFKREYGVSPAGFRRAMRSAVSISSPR